MIYVNDDGLIYRIEGAIKYLVGNETYTQSERIDAQTVVDISYTFDLELGQYEETRRVERDDPEPTPEPSPDQQRIAQLEADNLTLMEAIADLYEMMLGA